jgi:hypothetical protein
MGTSTGYVCRACGERFRPRRGGGFFFDVLHCRRCGAGRSVLHEELGEIHLRFVKGLPGAYAVARAGLDRRIKAEYQGAPIDRAEYHRLAEATLEPCACGGRFRYDAPARCPRCRSTSRQWDADPDAPVMHYD